MSAVYFLEALRRLVKTFSDVNTFIMFVKHSIYHVRQVRARVCEEVG